MQAGKADQMPAYVEITLDTTVNQRAKKNILLRTDGNEKQRCYLLRRWEKTIPLSSAIKENV